MTHVRVAIVGAGFAGIGMANRLLASGETSFVVLERSEQVGGTWRDNRYPGVSCDVDAHLYSYSFLPNPRFSRRFAPGAEILQYLESAAAPVAEHLLLGTELLAAQWQTDQELWRLQTSAGLVEADLLIVACGRLTKPRLPESHQDFTGMSMHSARWDDSVDLTDADVVVVGTGASAVQLIPKIAERARQVVVLQRSAAHVLPREDRVYSADEHRQFAAEPQSLAARRAELFVEAERGHAARVHDHELRAQLRDRAAAHLKAQVADAELRAALTPHDEFGCKRPLFSDDFYPSLQRDNVELVPAALTGFEADKALSADGGCYRADVVIFATGFEAARQPFAQLVTGRAGQNLAAYWSDGMRSFASTTVHRFPNLFVLDGPNASLGHNSAVLMMEVQFEYVLGALRFVDQHGPLEVTEAAENEYTAEMDSRSETTVWMSGCTNWYRDPVSGRQVLLWPGTVTEYADRFSVFDPGPYRLKDPVSV